MKKGLNRRLYVYFSLILCVSLLLILDCREIIGQDTDNFNVPIIVSEALTKGISGENRIDEPITVGIPLAEDSGIKQIEQLGLSGVSSQQFRPLAYWPNGNIKWVLIDTQVNVSANSSAVFNLVLGAGNSAGNKLAVDNNGCILIDTGPAQFRVKKNNFNFFDQVVLNGETLVTQGNNGGLKVYDENNLLYTSINDNNSDAVIEENGPLRSVIKAAGALMNESAQIILWYTVRMHFYKDKPYVKTFVTLRNASINSISAKRIRSMEVLVPLNLNGAKSFTFPTNKGVFTENLSGDADNAYLFQSFSTDHKFLGPIDDIYNFDDCKKSTGTNFKFTQPGLLVAHNEGIMNPLGNDKEWTQDWAEMQDSTGKGMGVIMKWMSAYWPAGFDFYGNGNAGVEFFSKHAVYDTTDPLIFGYNNHETRELTFNFHLSAVDNVSVLKRRAEAPLIAKADFGYYLKTKAIYWQDQMVNNAEENQWRKLQGLKWFQGRNK